MAGKWLHHLQKGWQLVIPPAKWRFPVIILLGIGCGVSAHIIHISKVSSYLSDRPAVCINCHIMIPEYSSWRHSSHGRATVCNDCHVPHDNFLNKYRFKAQDGIRHATIFTLRLEPQVIRIKKAGRQVVQQNCVRCHRRQVETILGATGGRVMTPDRDPDRYCWDCHRQVPHGTVHSLASAPYARAPLLNSPLPPWLYRLFYDTKPDPGLPDFTF